MTCIAGIEHQGRVYLAGDIQGTGWNNKVIHTQPKVFNKKGVIFGFTTSYRFGQILEHGLADPVLPDNPDEIYRWLISTLIPQIKAALKDNDWEKGGNCLIGVKDQLWELQDDFSVLRSKKGFGAVGSGYEYAVGSLQTTINNAEARGIPLDAQSALKTAIAVAGTFSPSVGTDSTLIST